MHRQKFRQNKPKINNAVCKEESQYKCSLFIKKKMDDRPLINFTWSSLIKFMWNPNPYGINFY